MDIIFPPVKPAAKPAQAFGNSNGVATVVLDHKSLAGKSDGEIKAELAAKLQQARAVAPVAPSVAAESPKQERKARKAKGSDDRIAELERQLAELKAGKVARAKNVSMSDIHDMHKALNAGSYCGHLLRNHGAKVKEVWHRTPKENVLADYGDMSQEDFREALDKAKNNALTLAKQCHKNGISIDASKWRDWVAKNK
jgi:hypothetical protein